MSEAPTLLDQDGRASIATIFLLSHHALRRDAALFTRALGSLTAADRRRARVLGEEWRAYREALHAHHHEEDAHVFPPMRDEHPELAQILDRLGAEHRRIDPMIERGERAFEQLTERAAEASAALAELTAVLAPHFASEEEHVVPLLRGQRDFPAAADEAQLTLFVDGFARNSHGVAPEVLVQLDAMLPGDVLARLPAARSAYDARWKTIWGAAGSGASRTAIPDWL
jgi:hypothetical protein